MKNLAIIDIQQLFLAARDEYGPLARVDFVKLRQLFKQDPADVVDAIAYVIVSPKHEDAAFVRFLKKCGYRVFKKYAEVDYKQTVEPYDQSSVRIIPKSWTYRMVKELHAFVLGMNYDHYYIVSGSNQFISSIKAIHEAGKKVTIVAFRSSLAPDFKKTGADEYIFLDKEHLYDENLYKNLEGTHGDGKVLSKS
jgi:uncharacterized LabA/DUF88 family protein